jgi:hypothetical protein
MISTSTPKRSRSFRHPDEKPGAGPVCGTQNEGAGSLCLAGGRGNSATPQTRPRQHFSTTGEVPAPPACPHWELWSNAAESSHSGLPLDPAAFCGGLDAHCAVGPNTGISALCVPRGGYPIRVHLPPRPGRLEVTTGAAHVREQAGATSAALSVPTRRRASTRKGSAETRKRRASAMPNAG